MEVISVNKLFYFMNICGLDSLSLEIIAKRRLLKSIGVKANLFSSLDDLEVMDEDYLSDSSLVLQ